MPHIPRRSFGTVTCPKNGTTPQDEVLLWERYVRAWQNLGLSREVAEREVREAFGPSTPGLTEGITTHGPSRPVELRDSHGGRILPRPTPRGPVAPAESDTYVPMSESEKAATVRAWMVLGLSEAAARAAVEEGR